MISKEPTKAGRRLSVVAVAFLIIQFCAVAAFNALRSRSGHLAQQGFNFRLYKYFAQLSDQGVDVFNSHALSHWTFAWNYLDFTPFNLLIYKVLFVAKGTAGDSCYYAYQFCFLAIAVWCVDRLATFGKIGEPQYKALLLLTAFNPLLLPVIMQEDKTAFLALPLLIFTLDDRPVLQAALAGLWCGWSGSGIAFLPIIAILIWRRGYSVALCYFALSIAFIGSLLPFFPESRILFVNRAHREVAAPFWYSLWRLAPGLYSARVGQLVSALFVLTATWRYLRSRITFEQAFVALTLTYCLFSNNTSLSRILTTLYLPILLFDRRRLCLLFAGYVASLEAAYLAFLALSGANLLASLHGFLDPNAAGLVLIMNVLYVNGASIAGAITALLPQHIGSERRSLRETFA